MTPTHRADPAQLRHDANMCDQIARVYPSLREDAKAMARKRRILAEALDGRSAPPPA